MNVPGIPVMYLNLLKIVFWEFLMENGFIIMIIENGERINLLQTYVPSLQDLGPWIVIHSTILGHMIIGIWYPIYL